MSSDSEKDLKAFGDEQPQHTLYLPDYYLAKTPVTNVQYAAFVRATGYQQPEHWIGGSLSQGKENHPVQNISWYDARAYCRWLSEVTGKRYNLPSEAEWEKGARGTDGRIYPWGNQWDAIRCNANKGDQGDTTPVDAYTQGASPSGVLDMAGNVWDWTLSLWGKDRGKPDFKYFYNPIVGRERLQASADIYRVLRGGASKTFPEFVRCAFRLRNRLHDRFWDFGFRVAMHQ